MGQSALCSSNSVGCSLAGCGLLSSMDPELATVKVDLASILPQAPVLYGCEPDAPVPGMPPGVDLAACPHTEAAQAVAMALAEVARIKAERCEHEKRMQEVLALQEEQHHLLEDFRGDVQRDVQVEETKDSPLCVDEKSAEPLGQLQQQNFTEGTDVEGKIKSFLAANKFSSIGSKRRRLLRVSYPLHVAAVTRNTEMVTLLLQARADPTAQDSFRRTPEQLARRCNRKGSHEEVLLALRGLAPTSFKDLS